MSSLVRLLLTIPLGLNLAALITTANDQFIYSGFSGSNLAVDGTATITPDGLLELTNGTAYQKGHAFHPAPFRLRDSTTNGNGKARSFSIAFVFGIVSVYPDFSAHGMAFVIAPRRNFSDALPAKYLGLTNVQNDGNANNNIFAVELDTIQSVEFKDINANHVGIRHGNLVELLGYCRRKGELLLVYAYMPNGSLDKHLVYNSREDHQLTLNWALRFQTINDVASGLLYLHERWEKVVIHRDIKASNVLLDKDMNAQLGDFGLARLYDHGADSHVVGTMGYLAPELIRTGRASPLTDMFAFGIFLLEVACGQRPIKEMVQGEQIALVDWVLEHWRDGTLMETVDARLQGEFDIDQAGLVLTLGLMCSHPLASARPGIGQAMRYLTGVTPLPELTPTDVLALMQNKGFDESAMSYPDLVSSFGTISTLSGGR